MYDGTDVEGQPRLRRRDRVRQLTAKQVDEQKPEIRSQNMTLLFSILGIVAIFGLLLYAIFSRGKRRE